MNFKLKKKAKKQENPNISIYLAFVWFTFVFFEIIFAVLEEDP